MAVHYLDFFGTNNMSVADMKTDMCKTLIQALEVITVKRITHIYD